MLIKSMKGFELEKSRSNSPEDFFNRSELTYEATSGKERTFSVVYLRYFEEQMEELTPFSAQPVFQLNDQSVYLRDIVALIALRSHPEYEERHRIYISDDKQFTALFEGIDPAELERLVSEFYEKGRLQMKT